LTVEGAGFCLLLGRAVLHHVTVSLLLLLAAADCCCVLQAWMRDVWQISTPGGMQVRQSGV
jgi:hypothetical protein